MDPGHNLDQLPHAYVNVSDDSYVDWAVPDAGMLSSSERREESWLIVVQCLTRIRIFLCIGPFLAERRAMPCILWLAWRIAVRGIGFGCIRIPAMCCIMPMAGLVARFIGLIEFWACERCTV